MDRVLFAPQDLPFLPPDVAHDWRNYDAWVRAREERRTSSAARGPSAGPVLHLIMLIGGAPPSDLSRTFWGFHRQTSRRWSMTVVVAEPWGQALQVLVDESATRRVKRRLHTVTAPDGTSAGGLLQRGIATNQGSAVALVFPGDLWAADAVATLSRALTPTGVVYADEDRVNSDGDHVGPRLKPDFSRDFLLSSSYIGRPLAVGSGVLASGATFDAVDVDVEVEHEFAVHACDEASTVTHIAEVLCHRSDDGMGGARPIDDVHARETSDGVADAREVMPGAVTGARRISRARGTGTSASIVIPFRDQPRFLRTCVDSVLATTREVDIELVLIDNGSSDPETATLVERLAERPELRILTDQRPFNWAELNNAGARAARGEVLLFLNNDIEALRTGWLSALCSQAMRPDIAAVGARLLYPDHRVQHCGIVVGLGGAAGHPLRGLPENDPGYLCMATATRECSAVTGACLATRREVFDELHGFDESLGVDLNDVDYCLRSLQRGYRVLYEPGAELIHYESPSRGTAGGVGDIVKFVGRWKNYIDRGDPYFNPHLTRADSSCGLAGTDEDNAWRQWHSTLAAH
jgi:GT2 family glycosyltransferase